MKKNAYVTIIASPELSEMRLDELVGRRGLVVEDLPQNRKKNRGGLVLLEGITACLLSSGYNSPARSTTPKRYPPWSGRTSGVF